jgi:hypothetical protein
MAVSQSDINLRVVIASASPDLSGVKQVGQEIVGMGQSAEAAVRKVSVEAGTLADKLLKINAGGGFKEVAADAMKAQAETDRLHTSINAGFGRSNQVLTDMGRIVSDMPYGIQGIGNNIMPLVESFNRAKIEAGGTGAAIKSVLAGLSGPMGLMMVGIPVVTSLAIAFGDKLVGAIGAGGEKIDDLNSKLSALGKYKDFGLAIEISGLEGIKRLQAELEQLRQQKDILEGSSKVDKAVVAEKPSIFASFVEGLKGYGASRPQGEINALAAQNAFYLDKASKVKAGKGSTGDPAYDAKLLNTYYPEIKKISGEAERIVALNQKNFEISQKESGIRLQETKDRKRLDKSGESAASKAANLDMSWTEAVRKANEALNRSGNASIPSIEEATRKVAGLTDSVKALKDGSNKSDLGVKRLNDAREQLTTAEAVQAKSIDNWSKISEKATASLDKGSDSTLSYLDALSKKDAAYASLGSELAMGDANRVAVEAAQKRYDKSLREVEKSTKAATAASIVMKEAFAGVGAVASLYGLNGTGVTGLLSGIDSLSSESIKKLATEKYGGDTGKAQASVYAGIAQSLGSVIGGKAGSAISGTATGALTGAALAPMLGMAGPVGAAIGGVIALAGALFGGDNGAAAATAADKARNSASALSKLADSGNSVAQQIMARNGYTEAGVSEARMASAQGLSVDQYLGTGVRDFGLFYTKENGYNQGLLTYLDAMNQIDLAVKSFASPSISKTVDDINWKYQKLAATSGLLADAELARMAELTVALTGLSVDSLTSTFESVVTSTSAESTGKAMADKVMEGLAASIRQMQIATFMQSVITPILQPLYAALVENMVTGQGTAGNFAAINSALVELTPTMTAFAQSLTAQGIAGNKAVDTTNALTDALGNFTASTSSFKTLLQQQYDNAKRIVDLQKSAYEDTVSEIKSLRSSLDSTLSSINGQSETLQTRRSAQADIAVAALLARTTGQLPLDGKLSDSLGVVAKPASGLYGSALDYARDIARTMADILALNDVAGTQLTDSELQINWLEKISGTMDRSYDNSVTAYDQYVIAAKAQIDGLNGIGLSATVTNLSLADQTAAAQSALQEQVSGFAGLIGGIGAVEDGVGNVENVMSTIELNQATYDAALKQVAGIYDVNASVVMVNSSIAALNQSVSASLAEKDAVAAATLAATQAAAAQEVATAQAAKAQAESQASEIARTTLFVTTFSAMGAKKFTIDRGTQWDTEKRWWNNAVDKAFAGDVAAQNAIKSFGYSYKDGQHFPQFASGGYHTGGVRLVGERGPELEITGPSRIISNRDTRSIFDVESLLNALTEVKREIAELRGEQLIGNSRIIINTRATANAVDLANNLAGVTG